MAILGASSLHPKIPFPAAVVQRELGGNALTEPGEFLALGHRRLDLWPTRPETTSSSHRRPPAMALTRRARRSSCSGLTFLRDLQLFRIESERLKLPAPFNRRIAKPFD